MLVYKYVQYLLFSYSSSFTLVSILPFMFWAIIILNIFDFYIMLACFLLLVISPLTIFSFFHWLNLNSAYFHKQLPAQHTTITTTEHKVRCLTVYILESFTFIYLFIFVLFFCARTMISILREVLFLFIIISLAHSIESGIL